MRSFGEIRLLESAKHIVMFSINGVKVDFVNFPYSNIREPIIHNKIRLCSLQDIAAMKLAAIINRGKKRDFFDIFILLKKFSLSEMISFYEEKYPDSSVFLLLKSLNYFEDADMDEEPVLLGQSISWADTKKHLKEIILHFDK